MRPQAPDGVNLHRNAVLLHSAVADWV